MMQSPHREVYEPPVHQYKLSSFYFVLLIKSVFGVASFNRLFVCRNNISAELKNTSKIIGISPGFFDLAIFNMMNKCCCKGLRATIRWYSKKTFLLTVIDCTNNNLVSFRKYIFNYPLLFYIAKAFKKFTQPFRPRRNF